jgi:hypothetical protein
MEKSALFPSEHQHNLLLPLWTDLRLFREAL